VKLPGDWKIMVCSSCERACCWQGEFMCDNAKIAGTKLLTVAELRRQPRGEHESYWEKDTGVMQLLRNTK
jgi:hypothetical protein